MILMREKCTSSRSRDRHGLFFMNKQRMCVWARLGQYNSLGEYCGPSTASEVFFIFTTQPYQHFSVFFIIALFSDKPEVFLSKYSQTAILHAAHFRG